MKKSARSFEVSLTMEDAAKARRHGESIEGGLLFLLSKGLTNLLSCHKGLTNQGAHHAEDQAH